MSRAVSAFLCRSGRNALPSRHGRQLQINREIVCVPKLKRLISSTTYVAVSFSHFCTSPPKRSPSASDNEPVSKSLSNLQVVKELERTAFALDQLLSPTHGLHLQSLALLLGMTARITSSKGPESWLLKPPDRRQTWPAANRVLS